jgi:hypothetical protein
MTRIVAVRLKLTDPGIPGTPLMMVVNVFETVRVTVTTRCLLGQLVAVGLVQSLAVGVVAENVPVSVAHWQAREATAVTPVRLVAAVAVVCMVATLPL